MSALPPLPEPEVQEAHWEGWSQYHDLSDPLPAVWDDEPPIEVLNYFSADQMQAYARAAIAAQAGAVERDAARYEYILDCDVAAARKYIPIDEAAFKAKRRAAHDAAMGTKP